MLLSARHEGFPSLEEVSRGWDLVLKVAWAGVNRAAGEMAEHKPPESICWDP